MTRRGFMAWAGAVAGAVAGAGGWGEAAEQKGAAAFAVTKSEAEWRAQLTPEQFRVLRQHGTERAGTSPLNAEHRRGVFAWHRGRHRGRCQV